MNEDASFVGRQPGFSSAYAGEHPGESAISLLRRAAPAGAARLVSAARRAVPRAPPAPLDPTPWMPPGEVDLLLTVPITSLIERDAPRIPDLGLGHLAAHARAAGFRVHVVDWNPHLDPAGFARVLRAARPRVVGVKVFTVNFREALETFRVIAATVPDAIRLIGGPHPGTTSGRHLFEEFPLVDFGFRGEVELTFPDFLRQLAAIDWRRDRLQELDLQRVPGLVWRDEGGATRVNPRPPLPDLVETGLPAWDLIHPEWSVHPPLEDRGADPRVAPLLATRGCPLSCTFCCAHHINGKAVRRRPSEHVVAEMRHLVEHHGIRQFAFTDSSFMLRIDWVEALCDAIVASGLDVVWECIYEVQGRIDERAADLEGLFRNMHRAGCRKVAFSPESASPEVIRRIGKHFDPEAVRRVHAVARRAGLQTMGFFLVGFPGETLEQMERTIDYALSEPYDQRFFGVLIPLPGTPIHDRLVEAAGSEQVIDWSTYDFSRPPVQLPDVPAPRMYATIYRALLREQLAERGPRALLSRRSLRLAGKIAVRRATGW